MSNYPEPVGKIANDYLDRVRTRLRPVPLTEREEFLRELESHIYEAYQQTPGEDGIARMLVVLRKLGDPAEVVSDRLPAAMMRSGTRRNLPLYIIGGIAVALFGIPLGFGGFAVVLGLLIALAEALMAYYVVAGSLVLVGSLLSVLGLIRMMAPDAWDKLIALGVLHIDGPVREFLTHFSTFEQGFLVLLIGSLSLVSGFGMVRLGRRMLRGLRFLFTLVFDWTRRFAQNVRRNLRATPASPLAAGELSLS